MKDFKLVLQDKPDPTPVNTEHTTPEEKWRYGGRIVATLAGKRESGRTEKHHVVDQGGVYLIVRENCGGAYPYEKMPWLYPEMLDALRALPNPAPSEDEEQKTKEAGRLILQDKPDALPEDWIGPACRIVATFTWTNHAKNKVHILQTDGGEYAVTDEKVYYVGAYGVGTHPIPSLCPEERTDFSPCKWIRPEVFEVLSTLPSPVASASDAQ